MADKSGIEWTDATWNPTTGCDRVSPGCANCLDPETPILMSDMRWRPIGEARVGDCVIGYTERPEVGVNRIYQISVVEAVWRREAPSVDIFLSDGRSITASDDHLFLAPHRPYWREAKTLSLASNIVDIGMPRFRADIGSAPYLMGYLAGAIAGDGTMRIEGSGKRDTKQSYCRVAVLESDRAILDRMVSALSLLTTDVPRVRAFSSGRTGLPMVKVETRRMALLERIRDDSQAERDDTVWQAGFLAGFFDTDGSFDRNLRFHQAKENDLLERTQKYITNLGYSSILEEFNGRPARSVRLTGRVEDKIRFLSEIQPALVRKTQDILGRRFASSKTVNVVGIRRGPVRELVDIQTSTRTFIANGIATHNCYALTLAPRLQKMAKQRGPTDPYMRDGDPKTSGPGFGLMMHENRLDQPLRWKKPRRIFVNSMSDLFHPEVPDEFLDKVFAIMALAHQHTFQVLTKRPERMREYLSGGPVQVNPAVTMPQRQYDIMWAARGLVQDGVAPSDSEVPIAWPLPNVWIGTSVENARWRTRVDELRRTPAAVRFLSCEPLLGPLTNLRPTRHPVAPESPQTYINLEGIDWVIIGGESGPGARPMDLDWVRAIVLECRRQGAKPFVKQLGDVWSQANLGHPGHAGEIEKFPEDLRVREYPTTQNDEVADGLFAF